MTGNNTTTSARAEAETAGARTQQSEKDVRRLDIWEDEGGALRSLWVDEQIRSDGIAMEDHEILRRLGASVVAQWNELPADVKRSLFLHATSEGTDAAKWKVPIARFLHARAVEGRPKGIPRGDAGGH